MEQRIVELACMVVNQEYATLLASDLKDYSAREKREALQSLEEQAQGKRLSLAQKKWLLANTTY